MTETRRHNDDLRQQPQVVWYDDELPDPFLATELLGEKAAGLREMVAAGVRVPPFFVITTAATEYPVPSSGLEPEVQTAIRRHLEQLEEATRRQLDDEQAPLLLAVRCSAVDVPAGLLPSVTNLGLNARTARGLLARTAEDRFVYDSYRRLISQFARLVYEVDPLVFDREVRNMLDNRGLKVESELDGGAFSELARRYLDLFSLRTGHDFPADGYSQLSQAVVAALRVGEQPRVQALRRRAGQTSPLPVAVIVQAMAFGNREDASCAGVAYTRDPQTGEDRLTGEFARRAQGADLAHGRAHPHPLSELEHESPEAVAQLQDAKRRLELRFGDALEMEFTVERGRLSVLQSRPAGRAGAAAIRIAVDLADSGVIPRARAVASITPAMLEPLLHARFDARHKPEAMARGFAASPGAATGYLAFSAAEALRRATNGERIVLVRAETDASDVIGMQQCEAILTSTGGMTSHAAVVARGIGKCCVVGAGDLEVDEGAQKLRVGTRVLGPDDLVSVDGSSGEVFAGELRRIEGELTPAMRTLLGWADEIRTLGVYANADTPEDAKLAMSLGADGIGLCRTEHMFFAPDRIVAMRRMILAGRGDVATREQTLSTLLAYQRADFAAIFATMAPRPIVVRLLDPPLHEFLPHQEDDQKALARDLDLSFREIRRRISQLREVNPMLGHRGCRLLVTYPEILEMQVRAIIEAAIECAGRGIEVRPSIMIPLTIGEEEMTLLAGRMRAAADQVMRERGMLVEYRIGSMIETPRAALLAGSIARQAQFLSFGTNDLTQTTLAISRDDAGRFLPAYKAQRLISADPFQTLDQEGVGELIRLAIERGRATRPDLPCGICGEHGAEAASIAFFHACGLNYVSCSPMRLPMARLAAAHAAMAAGAV